MAGGNFVSAIVSHVTGLQGDFREIEISSHLGRSGFRNLKDPRTDSNHKHKGTYNQSFINMILIYLKPRGHNLLPKY